VTIQPYDIAATTNLYGRSRVDTEQPVPPETATVPDEVTGAVGGGDRVFISSAARIYARFVNRVTSVLEEFVEDANSS